jgi:uncharacterized protein (TIGR02270 family)
MRPGPAVRWDVLEEHLDEAGFLHQQWEDALRSPLYTLAEIASGPEERMLAHADGLVLAGAPAVEWLLVPALAGEDLDLAFAAAFALLGGERAEALEAVLETLRMADPPRRATLRRALALAPWAELGPRLVERARRDASLADDLLEVLGDRGVDPGAPLESLAGSNEPRREALALRLARAFPGRLDPLAVARALRAPAPEVRAAALETALVTAPRGAMAACRDAVAAGGPGLETAALLLALSGQEGSVEALLSALGREEQRRPAAFALGFTGSVAAADALLAAMDDDALAPLAAEGFAAITGLVVEKRFALRRAAGAPGPEGEEEVAAEEAPPGPEGDLPVPAPEALAAWWKETRGRLDPARRWLRGRAWAVPELLRELEQGPARRRAALALDLEIRARGQLRVSWDALTARQQEQLAAARAGAGKISPRPYPA